MKNLSLTFCLGIAALFGSVGSGFASDLPPCPSSGYKHNCFGSISVALGKYVGEWQNGKPNGKGTFTFANGAKYVGEYKDGKQHGQGTYIDASGTVEVGIWQDGDRVGK